MRVTPDQVIDRGRRLHRHRRRLVRGGTGLAVLVVAVTGLGVVRAGGAPQAPAPVAAEYPVPPGAVFVAPGGDDAAPGTQARPLATLARAVAIVPGGGTIVMRGGIYREGLGGINKRITIQPFGSEGVWIKGSDVLTGWASIGSAWRSTTWTSPLCQTCYPAGAVDSAHPLAGKPDQVFRNGTPLTQVGSQAELQPGTFFVDPTSRALYLGDDPRSVTIEASVRWRALQLNAGAAGSALRGLHFSEYAPHWNEDQLAAVIVAAPNAVVENSTFTRSAGRSLGVFAPGVVVQGNSVVDNGGPGGNANRADGLIVRDNDFSRNNTAHFSVGSCGAFCTMAGLKVAHTAGVRVERNTFAGNDGTGFWCDLGCTDGVITGNTVSGNTNNGLYWEVSSRATLSGNRIGGNGRGVKVSGSDRVTVTGNTFTGNGVQLGVYDDPRSSSTDSYSAALGLSWNTTGTVVTTNTFSGGTAAALLLETNHTAQIGAAQMFARAEGNVVSGAQAFQWCPSACTRYATVAAFAAATGLPFGTAGAAAISPPPISPPPSSAPASSGPPPTVSAPANPTATAPTAREYLADAGFEASPLWWRTFGSGTVLTQVTGGRSGGHALRVASTATTTVVNGTTGTSTTLRTVAGHRYRASCWLRSASAITARVQVQEYTVAWQRVGAPAPSAPITLSVADRWYQVSVTYTATGAGNQLPLTAFSNKLADGGATFLVDDCSLTDA